MNILHSIDISRLATNYKITFWARCILLIEVACVIQSLQGCSGNAFQDRGDIILLAWQLNGKRLLGGLGGLIQDFCLEWNDPLAASCPLNKKQIAWQNSIQVEWVQIQNDKGIIIQYTMVNKDIETDVTYVTYIIWIINRSELSQLGYLGPVYIHQHAWPRALHSQVYNGNRTLKK